jgi:hypothetical protein
MPSAIKIIFRGSTRFGVSVLRLSDLEKCCPRGWEEVTLLLSLLQAQRAVCVEPVGQFLVKSVYEFPEIQAKFDGK